MPCPTGQELSAYHDGRLAGDRLERVKRHIAECQQCALELSRLVALSALLGALVHPALSQIARHRLHDKVDAAMERGLIRFGWSLSGIAASILLVSSAWLMHAGSTPQTTEAAPPWVGVATSSDAQTLVQDASTPAAAIYLADASAGSSSAGSSSAGSSSAGSSNVQLP